MSLDIEALFKQLQDISSGTHVQITTRTHPGCPAEPCYPTVLPLPPCAGPDTLSILKAREPGDSDMVYTPVSGRMG